MTFQFLSPKPSSHTDKVDADGDIDMLLKSERENFETQKVVTPGQVITSDTQYMRFFKKFIRIDVRWRIGINSFIHFILFRGHGTFTESGQRLSSVAGVIERVNKLISVR